MTILSSTMLAHEVNDRVERTQAEAGQIWVQIQSLGFPGGSDGKEPTCNAGDPGSIPGSGRSPREENGYLLQYFLLENSMHRGAWWATVHGVTKSRTY